MDASCEKCFVFYYDMEKILWQLDGVSYDPNNWRLFLDRQKRSVKCNIFITETNIPVSIAKETYENV